LADPTTDVALEIAKALVNLIVAVLTSIFRVVDASA